MNNSLAIIIPAYNEESSISAVIDAVNSVISKMNIRTEIVVINDSSTDTTGEIIDRKKCTALHLPVNLGIGGAMQTGYKYAFENEFSFALQLDGDGQHPAESIPILLSELLEKKLDIIIGSRFISKEGFQSSVIRRMGIMWFRWINRLLVGTDIKDSTSGFRMLNRKALHIASETYPDEYPEPESIILFSKHNLKIGEVPVIMKERQGGISSIGFFSSIYYMAKVTLGIIFTFIRIIK